MISTFSSIILVILAITPMQHPSEAATCNKQSHPPDQKPKLLLLHGFRRGAYVLYKVLFHLEALGYNVTVPDCRGAGTDLTNSSTIETFEQYNEPVERFMAGLGERERVMLVAHGAGGVGLTKVLHDHTDKVAVAMYASATMLKNNYVTCEDLQIGTPYFSDSKCNASCPQLPDPACFEKTMDADGDTVGSVSEDEALGRMLARPGPYRAILTSKMTGESQEKASAIDNVPRVYIKTSVDSVLAPEKQDAMIKLWPPCEVVDIRNDHNFAYDKPQLFAALVVNATRYA